MGRARHGPRGLVPVPVLPLFAPVLIAALLAAAPPPAAAEPGPDMAKINISLQEYEGTMAVFLETRRRHAAEHEDTPELVTFDLDTEARHAHPGDAARLKYKVAVSDDFAEVESSSLRLLFPAQRELDPTVIRVRVSEVLGARRRRFLDERTLYLSPNATKWCDFDVSAAVRGWIRGEPNLGLELVCLDCANELRPRHSAVVSLVRRGSRVRRQAFDELRLTECEKAAGSKKRKCCRHPMKVNLVRLPFAEMKYVVEPKNYEAGYCHGLCPPDYHPATNHSRIQGFVRQQMNRGGGGGGKRKIPKACCTPSKLGPLDIVSINKDNPTKLTVQTWDNMRVIACACS